MPKSKTFQFEAKLNDLNKIVSSMEQGDLPLEDALKLFEKGVGLTKECQKALAHAHQQVKILTENDEDATLTEYESDFEDE